jgi:hypothetical protein
VIVVPIIVDSGFHVTTFSYNLIMSDLFTGSSSSTFPQIVFNSSVVKALLSFASGIATLKKNY